MYPTKNPPNQAHVNVYQDDTNTIRPNFDFAMFKVPDGTVKDKIDWNKHFFNILNLG